MNAQIKTVEQQWRRLRVVAAEQPTAGRHAERLIRLRRALVRIRLLLQSPVASFRWAMARQKAIKRKYMQMSKSRQRHSNPGGNGEEIRVLGF